LPACSQVLETSAVGAAEAVAAGVAVLESLEELDEE
jgi:hypothetical protein